MTLVEGTGAAFTLQQRYEASTGEILATGVQALVRLPMDIIRADRAAGHNTAAFISGYQGSPLGGYDRELQSQRKLLDELGIVHVPGVNEELAATSVMGSQLSMTYPRRKYDGVVGIWYGKSPGLDRAGDAIRHANFAGTPPLGGVVALVGDDSASKSSTLPSRSDMTLAALHMPILYPGNIEDILELGRYAIAMSRASGTWVAFKITTPVADGSGTAAVGLNGRPIVIPTIEIDGKPWKPTLSGNIVTPFSNVLEAELLGPRTEMARRFIEDNGINRFVSNPSDAWLGIVAGGYECEQVLDALRVLGLGTDRLDELGIRVLKLRALNPLDVPAIRELARGVSTILVAEDKVDFLENRVRSALYGSSAAPAIVGRRDHDGQPLINAFGALTPDNLVEALRRVITLRVPADQLASVPAKEPFRLSLGAEATRTPFFCSGCPHNTGLQVPENSLVGSGIGCHGMVSLSKREATGTIMGITQMGGEGSQWIGIAPFVEDRHFFQNIGDGTYFHSGQLSVQAAVSAGTTITFKILYNAAVAMTGGQDASGLRPVPDLARKLLAEGVKKVVITTDDPDKYGDAEFPNGVQVLHRDKIVEAQEGLRKIDGVTVLIHDQQCAAEKRRDRKRGILAPAGFKVVIDERVCEGCGDCGVQSNCLSLHPLETEFGRKTTIDQASCNVDVSCIRGDCPAFVTVKVGKGGAAKPKAKLDTSPIPEPAMRFTDAAIRMPGIGGTGVVTISQVLAAASQIAGKHAHTVDQTGLSQKAGPVVSTIWIGEPAAGEVDVLLAFDSLASATAANLSGLDKRRSVAVMSTSIAPTGRMVGKINTVTVNLAGITAEIESRTIATENRYVDASHLTTALLGNGVTANVFLLGVAFQAGFIPLPSTAIERAIELNGTAVEANLGALRWGRRWYLDPAAVEHHAGEQIAYDVPSYSADGFDDDADLRVFVERRAGDLIAYQNRRYADRYVGVVRDAYTAERAADGDGTFVRTVARQLHHVMAYKDEYEVARLLLEGRRRVASSFGGGARLTWNLHPPMLRAMGLGSKLKLGPWSAPMLHALRAAKGLRGTAIDVPGYAKVRRAERALIDEYSELVRSTQNLLPTDAARATQIVGLVDMVRGYESVKTRNLEAYRTRLAELLASS